MNRHYSRKDAIGWQTQYTAEEAHWDDLRRMGVVLVPLLLLIFIMLMAGVVFSTIHGSSWSENANSTSDAVFLIFRMAVSAILPLLLLVFAIIFLYKATIHFLRELYLPPEDFPLLKRIQQRLLGVPPLPKLVKMFWKYPFITIKEPGDLDAHHWVRWLGGPATLVVYDGNALYLERGNQFSRIVGPGSPPMPFLMREETVKAVVDLRPQVLTQIVKPWTKDGIQLKLNITIECQISASEQAIRASRNLVYPFDPLAVKQAVEYTAVKSQFAGRQVPDTDAHLTDIYEPPEPTSNIQGSLVLVESDWLDGVWGKASGYINRHISCYSIDEIALSELSEIGETTGNLYNYKFAPEHIKNINDQLAIASCGAKVTTIQMTMTIPDAVRDYRIKYWESEWQKRASIRQSKSEGARIRLVEEAHARANKGMLEAITGQLKDIDPDNLAEPILMSLAGIMENSLDDPVVRPIIAKNSLDLLDHLRDILKGGYFDREDHSSQKKDQEQQ